MAEGEYFNRIGIVLVLAGLSSILFLQDMLGEGQSGRLGIALIGVGFLVMALGIVRSRLAKMGAEAWALGSIITYVGFVTMASPLAINVVDETYLSQFQQYLLFGIGVLVIILGYGTERWDLNVVFLRAWEKFVNGIIYGWTKFKERLRKSPLSALAAVLAAVLVTTFFTDIEVTIGETVGLGPGFVQLFLIVSILILVGIEAREIIHTLIISLARLGKVVGKTIADWMKNFPRYISRSISALTKGIRKFASFVGRLFNNSYVIGFIVSVYFFVVGLRTANVTVTAGGVLLTITSFALLSVQQSERVTNAVSGVQRRVIARSIGATAHRNSVISCPTCSVVIREYDRKNKKCSSCGTIFDSCVVCYDVFGKDEQILTCPHCASTGHAPHVSNWLNVTGKCPVCKSSWTV